jgi:ABC-type branched-subunit amino acid transport system ATPase component
VAGVIQVSGIRKTYGRTVAIDEVSFEVNDGEIFGLIGPNGAGKTTTMECVEGLGGGSVSAPSCGTLHFGAGLAASARTMESAIPDGV